MIPILDRKRRLTQWDIKPPGYENVTAEQAKLSGMFPLPGAPRTQPMDPSKLQAFMAQPSGSVTNAALKPSNSRQAKRLLVHNLPASVTEESIVGFFNLQLNGLNITEGSDPCITAQISKDRSFALLEFKLPLDATMALALDGITMEDEHMNGAANGDTKGLSIRRPKDYIVPAVTDETPYEPGIVSNVVVDTQNKICISNIPLYLTDEQVTELLVSFGELKAFVLVKDNGTEESRVCLRELLRYALLTKHRALLSVNIPILQQLILLWKVSMVWSLETSISKYRGQVLAILKYLVSRWESMLCPCLLVLLRQVWRMVVCSNY